MKAILVGFDEKIGALDTGSSFPVEIRFPILPELTTSFSLVQDVDSLVADAPRMRYRTFRLNPNAGADYGNPDGVLVYVEKEEDQQIGDYNGQQ